MTPQNRLSMLAFLFAFAATSMTHAAETPGAASPDTAKEQRWADQIVGSLLVGTPEWLEADSHKFLAIFTEEQSGTPKGGVILLHGIGVHPDWPDVIHPLRSELPEHGWATLSIQLPVLPNEAEFDDYLPLIQAAAPRIRAALAFLKSKDIRPVVLAGHSLGAVMGSAALAEGDGLELAGFVAIGMGQGRDPRVDTTAQLAKLRVPVFDLYGSRDLDAVRATIPVRAAAARRAGLKHYRQTEVVGADHFFVGQEEELVRRVRGWLEQLPQ
ncbi:MAG: alpha/beta fold hydrolase [Gammaproteobacteria bacterium]